MSTVVKNLIIALIAKHGESILEEILAILNLTDAKPDEIKSAMVTMRAALAKPGTQVPTPEELAAQVKAAILAAW